MTMTFCKIKVKLNARRGLCGNAKEIDYHPCLQRKA